MCSSEIKYFGFWPVPSNHFNPERLNLDAADYIDDETKSALFETIIDVTGDGWRFAVTGDYLCLLHLSELEGDLQGERAHNADAEIYQMTLGVSHAARFHYCECLNGIYFLIFAASFTGRGNYFLHDFSELSIWSCGRFTYDSNGTALRGGQFVRAPEQQLRRLRVAKVENPEDRMPVEHNIFRDAAHYWSVVYALDLHPTAAIGAKIVSEHRLENFRASAALAWFEIEKWLVSHAIELGIDVYKRRRDGTIQNDNTGNPKYKNIYDVIEAFPVGTWMYANKSDFHSLRDLRNQIAHKGYTPTQPQSAASLDAFTKMFNFRSGLNLTVDTHRVPTLGVS